MPFLKPLQLNIDAVYQEQIPCKQLANYIAYYWEVGSSIIGGLEYLVIPDGCVDLFMNVSNYNGLFIAPSVISHQYFSLERNEIWFGIRFYPLAIHQFFPIRLAALCKETALLKEVLNSSVNEFSEAILAASTHQQRVKSCNQFLQKQFHKTAKESDARIINAVQKIYQSYGNASIEKEVATWISPRQLRRLFKQEIGLTPKEFSRIIRFQFSLQRFFQSPASIRNYSLADYYDQSHFIKEFKQMTGKTPSEVFPK